MNSLSSLIGLGRSAKTISENSINYINRSARLISVDFSGTAFTDLSNTYSYSTTACGLNMLNQNSTFSRLRINNNAYLNPSHLGTNSFDIYIKHKARFNTLKSL